MVINELKRIILNSHRILGYIHIRRLGKYYEKRFPKLWKWDYKNSNILYTCSLFGSKDAL